MFSILFNILIFRKNIVLKNSDIAGTERSSDLASNESRIQRLFQRVPWLYNSGPNRVSAATQTAGVRRTAGTQTEQGENELEEEHFV